MGKEIMNNNSMTSLNITFSLDKVSFFFFPQNYHQKKIYIHMYIEREREQGNPQCNGADQTKHFFSLQGKMKRKGTVGNVLNLLLKWYNISQMTNGPL